MTPLFKSSVALAAASILASCQSATTLANPPSTMPATTTAATQPTKTFSLPLASPDVTTNPADPPMYTTSTAPATVHVNALNLINTPLDWLNERYSWNFGDTADPTAIDPRNASTIHLNRDLTGPVAAYEYETPGTYTITLTRTLASGTTQIFTARVIVPPSARTVYFISPDGNDSNIGTDPNHPLQTADAALLRTTDHTEFRFRRGSIYRIEPEFSMKHHDVVLDCFGDATQPLPIFQRNPRLGIPPDDCMVFTFWPGSTSDVIIRHLRVDSPWTPAFTQGQYAYHQPAASFGILRGSNITIADCELDNLEEGPHCDPTATGVLLLRNQQVDPLGIPSRIIWLEGRNEVAIGNVATNSIGESPLRAASTGLTNGLIAYNDIAQQLDASHDRGSTKAAVTLRTMQNVLILNNRITNAEFSFDPHSDAALDLRFVADGNAIFNTLIDIKTNVRHGVFRNNSVATSQGPCIVINPGGGDSKEWIEDLQLIHNTGQGSASNGRMLQMNDHTPTQLKGFLYDPATNIYTHASTAPGK